MSVDTHRLAFIMDAERRGWSDDAASLAALAIHPLDDAPVPTRRYEKAVRKQSRQVARSLKRASEGEALALARDALEQYRRLAVELGESHYQNRYDKALGLRME